MAQATRVLEATVPDFEIPPTEQEEGGGPHGVQIHGHMEEVLGDENTGGGVEGDDPTDEVLAYYKGKNLVT